MQKKEFDLYADDYYEQHKENIKYTGKNPDFFAEYKIEDLYTFVERNGYSKEKVLDFGSGIGNSIPFFRKYFCDSELYCADVSINSIDISKRKYGDKEKYLQIKEIVPVSSEYFDIIYSACVFHHIGKQQHLYWLGELLRLLKPGGVLVVYEHNPKNPLTVHAVNTCPFDKNAEMITANMMKAHFDINGYQNVVIEYKMFVPLSGWFPKIINHNMRNIPIGAQYRVSGLKKL